MLVSAVLILHGRFMEVLLVWSFLPTGSMQVVYICI